MLIQCYMETTEEAIKNVDQKCRLRQRTGFQSILRLKGLLRRLQARLALYGSIFLLLDHSVLVRQTSGLQGVIPVGGRVWAQGWSGRKLRRSPKTSDTIGLFCSQALFDSVSSSGLQGHLPCTHPNAILKINIEKK